MIGMAPVERIIELALRTAYLEGEIPQSILFLSEVEQGKSATAMQFQQDDGSVVLLHDATAFGILKRYKDALLKREVRHFIFPEFVFPLSRSKDTTHTFLAFLNGLMDEGILEIQTYATTVKLPRPIHAGIIACLAREEFEWRKYYWSSIGFLSRFLPVSYSYSEKLEGDIFEAIYRQQASLIQHLYEFRNGRVKLNPDLARRLNPQVKSTMASMAVKSKDGNKQMKKLSGIRMQKHFQRLIKAAALSKGKEEVDEDDLREIIDLSRYINLEYNQL